MHRDQSMLTPVVNISALCFLSLRLPCAKCSDFTQSSPPGLTAAWLWTIFRLFWPLISTAVLWVTRELSLTATQFRFSLRSSWLVTDHHFLSLHKLKPHLHPTFHGHVEFHKPFNESFFGLGLGSEYWNGHALESQAEGLLEGTRRQP